MTKARAWRRTSQPAKRTHGAATLAQSAMPTRERLAKGGFEVGGDGGRRIVRMLDTPLEQARARAQITDAQYDGLARYRMHWFLGHLAGNLRAIDMDRVIGSDRGGVDGTFEQVLWHRQMFDVARDALPVLERLAVAGVVLDEVGVTEVGAGFGYRSAYRGRQFVLELLCSASQEITSAWLTMDRS